MSKIDTKEIKSRFPSGSLVLLTSNFGHVYSSEVIALCDAYDEQQKEITRLRDIIKTSNDALDSVESERYRDATTIDVRDILYSYSAYTIARKALAGGL